MKAKTKTKALLMSLCAVLLVAASVLGTMAYLTDSKHRLTRAHREKQLKTSCQALHNAPPNRT